MTWSAFPEPGNSAPYHKRYVGLYHYSGYWHKWDKIIAVRDSRGRECWIVQEVDLQGNPVGPIREHCTPQQADMFADRPFEPTIEQLQQCDRKRPLRTR